MSPSKLINNYTAAVVASGLDPKSLSDKVLLDVLVMFSLEKEVKCVVSLVQLLVL